MDVSIFLLPFPSICLSLTIYSYIWSGADFPIKYFYSFIFEHFHFSKFSCCCNKKLAINNPKWCLWFLSVIKPIKLEFCREDKVNPMGNKGKLQQSCWMEREKKHRVSLVYWSISTSCSVNKQEHSLTKPVHSFKSILQTHKELKPERYSFVKINYVLFHFKKKLHIFLFVLRTAIFFCFDAHWKMNTILSMKTVIIFSK